LNIIKKASVFILIIMCMSFSAVCVFADEQIDFEREASIQVDMGMPDASARIYYVTGIDGMQQTYGLRKTYAAAEYPVLLEQLGSSGNSAAAQALEYYYMRDGVEAVDEKKSDSSGIVSFDNLPAGVYLISCSYILQDEDITVFSPILVSLPAMYDGEWNYDIDTNAKKELRTGVSYCKAYKVWNTNDPSDIPEEITVQLLRDGQVYDEKILNEDNSWRCSWYDLEKNHLWSVIEKDVPDGYTVGVEADGSVFILENTAEDYEENELPETPPGQEDTDEPLIPGEETEQPEEEDKKLDQTGQLWWPVVILLFAGNVILLAGIALRRTDRK